MARKTLDSISAAIGKAPTMQDAFHHTVDVRPIENGYIIRESKHNGDSYTSTERYSAEHPSGSGLPEGENLMRRAVDYMNKSR